MAVWRKMRKGKNKNDCKAPPKVKKPNLKWKYRKYNIKPGDVPKGRRGRPRKTPAAGSSSETVAQINKIPAPARWSTSVDAQMRQNIKYSTQAAADRVEYAKKQLRDRAKYSNIE